MAFKMGFVLHSDELDEEEVTTVSPKGSFIPKKSLVRVRFPKRERPLTYYNDLYDLHPGDLVYVDGKLEGCLGRVAEVIYDFKIKLSDYKRVVTLVDTDISGKFFIAGDHLVTFHPELLSRAKVSLWYFPPAKEDEEFVVSTGDDFISLCDLSGLDISDKTATAGREYYLDCRVQYLSLDDRKGYAIISGSKPYEIEFDYFNGRISHLHCSCFCANHCKHEVALLLQLRELLETIEKNYSSYYEGSNYFAALIKQKAVDFSIYKKTTGKIRL